MRVIGQIRRLSPTSDEKLDGNAYLGLMALMGAVGWGYTAWVLHFENPPPKGVVGLAELGAWIEAVSGQGWELVWLWVALFVGVTLVTVFRLERGALLTIHNAVWSVGTVVALGLNALAVNGGLETPWLVWLPWLVLFAVAYLVTGVLATRGWVYLLAGGVSAALAANGVYGVLTNSGCLVVTLNPVVETPLAGAVFFPMPLTYVVFGVLHVVPLTVDALQGGRGMTGEGVPAVQADRMEGDDAAGGVVPE